MNETVEHCIERYFELAGIARTKLKAASTPSMEERSTADDDFDKPGEFPSIAAKVLMNILCAAQMVRFDLL